MSDTETCDDRPVMTLGKLLEMRLPSHAEERHLAVRIQNPGGLTAHQTVDIISAYFGIDWQGSQLVLEPRQPVCALSAQELEEFRKSAKESQSWHTYNMFKNHQAALAERDAKIAELEAREREARELIEHYASISKVDADCVAKTIIWLSGGRDE